MNLDVGSDENKLDNDLVLKVMDFGLAHIIPNKEQTAFMKYKCGTFNYRAPEVQDVINT